MKNILNATDREAVYKRLETLTEDAPAHWGRMNVNQMVCHLADQLRVAFSDIKTVDRSNWFTRVPMKHMALLGAPAPKGKVKTAPEIDQAETKGTPPTDLASDIEKLKEIILQLDQTKTGFQPHPLFGQMNQRQWGRMVYIHMDHHLKQFGA